MVDNNPALTAVCRLEPDGAAVVAAIAHARRFAATARCGAEAEARLLILIEEAVSNIIEHGTPPVGSSIGIEIAAIGADIGVTITDAGPFFDPRGHYVEERVIANCGGGAGIALIRAWSTVIAYDREDGINRLKLVIANHG